MAKKKSRKEQGRGYDGSGDATAAVNEQARPVTRGAQGAGQDSLAPKQSPKQSPDQGLDQGPHCAATEEAPPTQGEHEDAPVKAQSLYADVRAQREARNARARDRGQGAAAPCPAGHVRRSTLYLAVGLALVAGLFVGTLLPTLGGHSPLGSAGSGAAPAQQAQTDPKEDTATKLAGHILELEEAVRKNPNDAVAWVQLGNLYFDSSKAPQAINAYERALLLKPDDANVLTDLGVMYREVGKYELAVQSFRNASRIDPKHQNALFNRGVVLFFDLKRKEEGRKAWQELLALNPQAKAPDGRPLKDMLRDLK